MARHLHNVTLTIPNGSAVSNIVNTASALGPMVDADIFSPTVLPESVVLQLAPVQNPATADWKTSQWQPGTDTIIAANRAVSIPFIAGVRAVRVSTVSGNVVGDRVFIIVISLDAEYAE